MSAVEMSESGGPMVPQVVDPIELIDDGNASSNDGYQGNQKGFFFWAAIAWLIFIVICVLAADWIPGLPGPEERIADRDIREGPSAAHWFGLNNRGHDVFARSIHGARISMGVALVATIGGIVIGGTIGVLAGFYRRGIDATLTALINIMLAVPGLVLALTLVGFFAPSGGFEDQRFLFFDVAPTTNATIWATIALSILAAPSIARVARAQTLVWSDREFVLASRTIGTRNMRIIFRDLLPNVLPAMVSFALIGIAVLVVVQATLAFFGVGDVTATTWGGDINIGRDRLDSEPHMVLGPSLFMFLTVLSLNYLADKFTQFNSVREAGV